MKIQRENEKGTTLIDCTIALVISLVGIMAIYSLVVISIKTQTVSKDIAIANSFARAKLEELRNTTNAAGGDLNANSTGYFDSPAPKYYRRWQVSIDTFGSQTVSVRVLPVDADPVKPDLSISTRIK